ncbi:hypothetical protein GYMLUDRAFT_237044 [Collybiopsis luxurians FD-317 M1]|nr:hypothetical protein GYMLUDRAFT_237044 [Collybiopsis luxurians FD-317 M1]
MTPVQKLPQELLTEFFHLVDDPLSLTVLSSVCSHWRAIVIETPSLWKTIFLPEMSMKKLQIHLQRSKFCPLTIRIYASYVFDDHLLTLLIEHSERWEEVVLNMPASLYTSLSSVRGRTPLLKRFTFIALNPLQVVNFRGIETAPALREVVVNPLDAWSTEGIPFPTTQLTKLQCDFYNTSLLCSLLTRIPNVSELRLRRWSYETVSVSYPDISFPELRILEMHMCEITLFNFLLSRAPNLTTLRVSIFPLSEVPVPSSEVILPHLRHLVLDGSGFPNTLKLLRVPKLSALELNDGDPKRDMIALRDLIVRSGCKLGTFKLTIYTDLAPGTALLLKAMPSLKHLNIAVYSPKDIPFHLITPVSQVFPKLQTFSLSATNWDAPAALSELVAFTQSNDKLKVSLRRH